MAFPSGIIVECAFNNDYDETSYAQSGYTEITPWVDAIAADNLRGREHELGRPAAGTMNVTLDNEDRRFTPMNPRSPYYPNVKPGRRFRIRGKNMVHPNVARGGGRDRATTGFDLHTAVPSMAANVTNLRYVAHDPATYPALPASITSHVEVTLSSGAATGTRRLVEWYVPMEYGVRLTHSVYVWKVSGTENAALTGSIEMLYYDSFGQVLASPVISSSSFGGSWSGSTPTTPTRRVVSHAPPSTAKYAKLTLIINNGATAATDLVYAVAGAQSELPANLAPNVSGWIDTLGWSIKSAATAGTVAQSGVELLSTNQKGIETDASGWVNDINATVAQSSAQARTGTKSLSLTTATTYAQTRARPSTTIPVSFGETLTFSAWFRAATTGRQVSIQVRWKDAAGGTVTVTSGTAVTSNTSGWVQATHTVAVPAGSASAEMLLTVVTTVVGEVHYADDMSIVGNSATSSIKATWAANDTALATSIPHLMPTIVYSASAEVLKSAGPDLLMSADDGQTGAVLSANNVWTTLSVTFTASTPEQELKWIPQSTVTAGHYIQVRKLNVQRVDTSPGLASSGDETGVSTWERPKDIFEGWTENWQSTVGQTQSTISVVDRMKRVGDVKIGRMIAETLFNDLAELVIPMTDAPEDAQGQVANWGLWGTYGKFTTIPITATKGDLSSATYEIGYQPGPTGDDTFALSFSPTAIDKGYFLYLPYSADFRPPDIVTNPPATSAPVKYQYTTRYPATWSRSYNGSGNPRFDDPPTMYQGSGPGGSNGNQSSLFGFNWAAIQADLAGAEILSVVLTMKNAHAYWHSGMGIWLGYHNHASKPATFSHTGWAWTAHWAKYAQASLSLGVGIGYQLQNGSAKGFSLTCQSSCSQDNYGYFNGASGPLFMDITYRK